jgi:DUF1365 family protein
MAYLDLDELPEALIARRGWSTRPAPFWFRRRDYLDGSDRPLAGAVLDLVDEHLARRPTGPVRVLTQVRTFGWLFNPLTTYYCCTPDGSGIDALVLEVTNTPWHERSWYVLDGADVAGRGRPFPKELHVSPFLPMDLAYRCRATLPDENLALRLELTRGSGTDEDRVFDVDLVGVRRELTDAGPRAAALRHAAQTVGVSAAIHAHAVVLAAKGATVHRHPRRRTPVHEPAPVPPRPPAPSRGAPS